MDIISYDGQEIKAKNKKAVAAFEGTVQYGKHRLVASKEIKDSAGNLVQVVFTVVTKAMVFAVVGKYFDVTPAEMGRTGGRARAKNLSKGELSSIGKKGAEARWGKKS